ncbi:hypothetical protein, partial [Arcticibacter tournemirensis]
IRTAGRRCNLPRAAICKVPTYIRNQSADETDLLQMQEGTKALNLWGPSLSPAGSQNGLLRKALLV